MSQALSVRTGCHVHQSLDLNVPTERMRPSCGLKRTITTVLFWTHLGVPAGQSSSLGLLSFFCVICVICIP